MPVFLKAITPKRIRLLDPQKVRTDLRKAQFAYLTSVKEELQEYPPPSRAPRRIIRDYDREGNEIISRGSSRGGAYKRTYNLRNSWRIVVSPDGANGVLFTDPNNPASKYAVYVQGPRGGGRGKGQRQTAVMRRKGWKSITDVSRRQRKLFETVTNRAVKGAPR